MKKISKLPKKLLSLFIAVLMVVSSMPFTAFAATATEIYDGLDAEFKSHQVGFFFSNASTDPKYDKISGENKLTGSGATWDSAEGGFKFNGSNADHLYIKASDILSNVTAETGFTIHFEAKSLSREWQRYFDFMCSEPLGDGNTYYLCASPQDGGKVCIKHSDGASGYKEMEQIGGMNTSDGQWHTYTIAVSNSTVEVWVDGKAYASRQVGLIDSNWFNTMRENGYIRFGISAFRNDSAYDGWLKNVHIYDTAYTEPYLFAYFTGNGSAMNGGANTQAIRFALSTNGVDFTPLNSNNPVIAQTKGTQNARDPYMFKGQDGYYYTIATDMDCTSGWSNNSQSFVIWKSADLINWTNETIIDVAAIIGNNVQRAWAPQVVWDASTNKYMVYFALAAEGYSSTRMYYMLTDDLLNQASYSMPTSLYDPGADAIDGDIIEQNGVYYLFYKDETNGRKTICLAKANALKGPYDYVGKFDTDSATTGALEGCQVYTVGTDYYLVADRYGDNGKFAIFNLGTDLSLLLNKGETISTTDGSPITTINALTGFQNLSARHGSIVKINKQQYDSLKAASFNPVNVNKVPVDLSSNLVARYLVNDLTTDEISGAYPLTGSAEWNSTGFNNNKGAAYFNGNGAYLQTNQLLEMLPDMGSGFTISFYGNPSTLGNDPSHGDFYDKTRFLEINNKGANSWNWIDGGDKDNPYSYITYRARNGFEVCYLGSGAGTARNAGTYSEVNKWHQYTLTYKLEDNKEIITIYCDGVKGASVTAPVKTTPLYQINGGYKYLCLGASGFKGEWYTGYLRDVRVYNKAVDSIEAYKLATFYDHDAAIKSFEEKMNSGKVYTNMKPAYDAYVNLNKAIDSYYYGQNLSVDVSSYVTALSTAIDNMKEWTVTKGNAVPKFTDSNTNATSGYANLIYSGSDYNNSVSTTGVIASGTWENRQAQFEVCHNSTVMMYDGETTPKMPVVLVTRFKRGAKVAEKPSATYACYPTPSSGSQEDHGALKFTQLWTTNKAKGDSKVDRNFNTTWGGTSENTGWSKTNLDRGGEFSPPYNGWGNYCQYSNVLEFDTTTSWSGNEYYKKDYGNLNWCYVWSEYGSNLNSTMQYLYGTSNSAVKVYVVNIVPLKNAINTAVPNLIKNSKDNVTNYKEGGLSDALTHINNATSYNPNSACDKATTASAVATNFENAVKPKVENLNSLTKTPDKEDQYIALRKAFDYSGTIPTMGDGVQYSVREAYNGGANNAFSSKSYKTFKKKYEAAQNIMKAVLASGYVNDGFAGEAATALLAAFNALEPATANITFENLFSFDDFYNSSSASEKTSLGEATYNRSEKTITTICNVEGNNDNYTSHDDLPTLYKIPVTAGKTYFLEFTADNENADAMIFVPNDDETGFDKNYVKFRGGHVNGHNRIEITVPDGKNYVYFRFGSTNVFNVSVTFSNIVFYEADREAERGNLTVTEKSVTPGQPYGTLPAPTRDGYVFKGWFADKEFTKPITAETIAVAGPSATNLYANWHAHNYEDKITLTQNGDYYTWTGECSCGDGGTKTLGEVEASAYNKAIESAKSSIENTVKYKPESIEKLQKVVHDNTITKDVVKTQEQVEECARNIVSANQLKTTDESGNEVGVLELRQYTVNFNTVKDDNGTELNVSADSYDYGSVVTLKKDGITPYKWMISDKKVAGATDEFTLVVTSDTKINAYYYSQTAPSNQHVVSVYGRHGKLIGCMYVENGKTLRIDGPSVTDGTSTVTHEKLPFYQVIGYKLLDGTSIDGYKVTQDIDIYPIYNEQKEIVIKLDKSNANIYFENDKTKLETEKTVVWDQKITVKSDEEVVWYVNGKAVAKGTSYIFRASNAMTISAKKEAVENPSSVVTYAAFDATNRKARIAVSNYSSNNYVIKEQGIILATTSNLSATYPVDKIVQNGKKFVATKTTDTGNQFSYTISFETTTNKKLCIVSYVVYKNGTDEVITVYSNDVTYVDIR